MKYLFSKAGDICQLCCVDTTLDKRVIRNNKRTIYVLDLEHLKTFKVTPELLKPQKYNFKSLLTYTCAHSFSPACINHGEGPAQRFIWLSEQQLVFRPTGTSGPPAAPRHLPGHSAPIRGHDLHPEPKRNAVVLFYI